VSWYVVTSYPQPRKGDAKATWRQIHKVHVGCRRFTAGRM
jgi:hypothetical protein